MREVFPAATESLTSLSTLNEVMCVSEKAKQAGAHVASLLKSTVSPFVVELIIERLLDARVHDIQSRPRIRPRLSIDIGAVGSAL